ncbi:MULTISPECIES: tyrosinase family oxidase copper chaperone [unclassified Streptomyces]|uniref:apotyrosinase chaperone MelC1 n=1 Tax=unclassified Streptomyces TaxID=2593676 RepID=UPI003811B944
MPQLSRRHALTAVAALAATAGAAGTVAATAAPADVPSPAPGAGHPHAGPPSAATGPAPFDEVYRGRRIRGGPSTGGGHHGGGPGGDHGGHHGGGQPGGGYAVFVDDVELHVMRNADGTWISVISHYDPVATPRAAARAAVDELQGARLLPFPAN